MTQSFVTQCPHCRTSFRVNLAQLGAAHGAVRCGACLHVFNAAQQLREQGAQLSAAAPDKPAPAPTAPPASPPASSAAPSDKADETLWIHDDLDLDSLDLDEELAKLEEQEQQLSRQFLAIDQAPSRSESFPAAEPEEADAHDERWAEALLHEDAGQSAPAAPASRAAPTPPAQKPAAAPADTPEGEPLAAAEDDAEPVEQHFGLRAEREPLPEQDDDEDAVDSAPAAPRKATPSLTARSEPELRDSYQFDLDEDPLQLDWQPAKKPWGRWLGWGLLNLLAASALATQYVNYHFNELARQDQYRPWFEQLCPLLGCQLPSKVDITQVKSSNLVVRSHPEFSGALVVDAILYNRAPFSQPFPLLEMRFADINGQLLASRRFKPSEYLAGELAGKAEMPPQTPIHIALDILDPGTQAVNYSLSFHSPE
ncbi:DUF3426 domain-containing protein [Pseudomonas sp. EA_105y_Pfl2_R69]|uniref:DUF3426 domain-containing protein n=1 Tax=Pseudomonas sp. EA_105y_Pfl2_R69 TaxID=3088683 RepID=UPI0030D828F5